jgi:lipopolysaccharide transport system permease protein
MIVPAGAIVTSFVDFLIGLLIVAVMMAWFRFTPNWHIVALPLFLLMAIACSMGLGLLFTALNVKYRDFRYVIPFLLQFGLYITPVGYSSSIVRQRFGETLFDLYCLNPMVGVVDGFRWSLLGGEAPIYWRGFAISSLVAVTAIVTGVWYFRKTERSFADII